MEKIWKLYQSGKSVSEISEMMNLDKSYIESLIINHKLRSIQQTDSKESFSDSILENILSKNKELRMEYLNTLGKEDISVLESEISSYITDKKNIHYEDIVSIVWIIGELQLNDLSEIICNFSSSKNGNIQRITYSTMGKLHNERFIPYLKMGCKSSGIQIRMYAIKSLAKYDFIEKKRFFELILKDENNPRNRTLLQDIIQNQ